MRVLERPLQEAALVFRLCSEAITNPELRARLEDIAPYVRDAEGVYDAAARAAQLYTVPRTNPVGAVTAEEMSTLYERQMSAASGPARPIYDAIRAAPLYGICPLCGHRVVTTLDHHLPKSRYPALAVCPLNLIPSCTDCNQAKGIRFPTLPQEQTLHPYFDNFESTRWLHAYVLEQTPPSVRFHTLVPPGVVPEIGDRLQRHFVIFKLGPLYSANASQELVNISGTLKNLYVSGGAEEVQNHLREQERSRRAAHLNSWQTAMYGALLANHWFCQGGLLEIG